MSDPLADLKRRAYARPTSAEDAAEAQAELARLAIPEHVDVDWYIPPTQRIVVGGRAKVAIAALALAAAFAAVVNTIPPGGSLDVFDRAQSPADLTAPGWAILSGFESPIGAEDLTIRWLADFDGSRLYAYRTTEGFVCLSLVHGMGTRITCTSPIDFEDSGLRLAYGTTSMEGPALTVVWGPDGGPMFYDGPVNDQP
ncbi:MAG: hypothetical protein JWR04_1401 [Rhodoglobus sp.]|nr:hypothetical protein [Rhodoglobus sp.]